MDICKLCRGIRFDKLPFEDEPGVPHQPTLAALEASAATCALCALIFEAAGEMGQLIKGANPGGFVQMSPGKLPSGRDVEFVSDGPWFMANSNLRSGSNEGRLTGGNVCQMFPGQTTIRPWLFGNWYISDEEKPKMQLIGLGVRLGVKPTIEDAEGNLGDQRNIYLRGTCLRIRANVGKYKVLGL
jgi:hypothetical protein